MAVNTKALQRALNAFTKKYLRGVTPLIVDGEKGHATNVRIRTCKFYLGYGKSRDSAASGILMNRLAHPRSRKHYPKKHNYRLMRTGMARRVRQRNRYRQQHAASYVAPGVTRYDGVPVAAWLVPYLQWARKHGWKGKLVSGWRSPAYSESLCQRMCGRPQCPGMCAGRASNHAGSARPRGALDVSDYFTFAEVIKRCPLTPRIYNDLPRDRVHFSANGR